MKSKIFFLVTCILLLFINNASFDGYADMDGKKRILMNFEIFGPLLLLLIYFFISKSSCYSYYPKWFLKGAGLFILLIFVVAFLRPDVEKSLRNFFAVFINFSTVLLLARIAHNIELKKLLRSFSFLFIFLILPINYYVQFTKGGGFILDPDRFNVEEDTLRFGGALYHAHNAMTIGIIFIFIFLEVFYYKKKSLVNGLFLLFLMVSLLLTNCRSIIGTLVFCSLVYFFGQRKNKIGLILLPLSIILLIGIVNALVVSETVANTDNDLIFRALIWAVGIQGLLSQPIAGYGNDNFFQGNSALTTGISDYLNDPHNALLDVFLQNGIPASLVLLNIFYRSFRFYCENNVNNNIYKIIFYFWIISPFFWGHIYNLNTGFITVFAPLTLLMVYFHPNNYILSFKIKN